MVKTNVFVPYFEEVLKKVCFNSADDIRELSRIPLVGEKIKIESKNDEYQIHEVISIVHTPSGADIYVDSGVSEFWFLDELGDLLQKTDKQ